MNPDRNDIYNPLQLLNKKLLLAMIKEPGYFVREYYARGKEEDPAIIPLLLTHYSQNDIDKERANRHYGLIKNDPYRFLYDSNDPEHAKRLVIASVQPKGYKIYVNLVSKVWKPPFHLRNHIYAYMLNKYPDWKNNRKLSVNLQDLFGKLYLIFTWQGNKAEVLLEEVEKFSSHVL
jgi:hypothetical protein